MPVDTLTMKEAATRVHMTTRSFRDRVKAGDIQVTRLGRRVLVRADLLQDWIERSTGPYVPVKKAA